MFKWIGRLIAVVVVLLIVAVVAIYFYLDSIAKQAIERGGSYATGVSTSVDSVSLGILGGTFGMKDFELTNPVGFQSDHFLQLGKADLAVSLGSLTKDVVVVPRLHLDDIDVNLERRNGEQNFDVILANLEKLSTTEETTEPQQWIVNDLAITNVTVTASGEGLLSDNQNVTFTIPSIELKDVKSDSLAELQGQIVKQVLSVIAQQAPGQVLGAMGAELTGGLAKVGDIGQATLSKVADVTGALGDTAKELSGAIGGVAPEAGKAIGDVGKQLEGVGAEAGEKLQQGLGGLLGGKKDKKEDEAKPAE